MNMFIQKKITKKRMKDVSAMYLLYLYFLINGNTSITAK